jgi:enoyl-CoA hydratase
MATLSFATAFKNSYLASWSTTTTSLRTPLIAAVSGYCLGGGCELAMMTDILYCTSSAKFGQPEITLGVLPGAGGTQRLTRAIGKAKAMELILTGRMFSGTEAESWGLAARTFGSSDECVSAAVETAAKIASFSRVAVQAAKESVNKSYEVGLREGVEYERKLFHGMFGTKDQKIGMNAFVKKDKNPKWEHE